MLGSHLKMSPTLISLLIEIMHVLSKALFIHTGLFHEP